MKLIGLAGKARTGKNTVGQYLSDRHGFIQMAMAGPLKGMLHALGLDPKDYQTTEQKETIIPWLGVSYRHCAQTLGTDWMRVLVNESGWLILAERWIRQLAEVGAPGAVITDMRFENEAAMVRDLGGQVIHLRSKRALEGMSPEARSHASESGIAVGPIDRVLQNDGSFLDLHRNIENLLVSLDAVWQ